MKATILCHVVVVMGVELVDAWVIQVPASPPLHISAHLEHLGAGNTSLAEFVAYKEVTALCRTYLSNNGSVSLDCQTWRPRHCHDLRRVGDEGRGVRYVSPFPESPEYAVAVYCDHTVDGGGWTVFQRRTNATYRQDFQRTWTEYRQGFGSLDDEFWMGLDLLHVLTQTPQEMRVHLADYEGDQRWAAYRLFSVAPLQDLYRLSVGGYRGNAGDAMRYHNGMNFSTYDADHDAIFDILLPVNTSNFWEFKNYHELKEAIKKNRHHYLSDNCARRYRGGWWYRACHHANPNGYPVEGRHKVFGDGINWRQWRGHYYSFRNTTFMIRPSAGV